MCRTALLVKLISASFAYAGSPGTFTARRNVERLEDETMRAKALVLGMQTGDYALSFTDTTRGLRRPLTTVFWRLAGRAPSGPSATSANCLSSIAPARLAAAGTENPEALVRSADAVIALLAPALLTALVVTETFGEDGHLVLDERAVGVGVAALALALRAPVLLAVALAALTTALLRAFG